MDAVTPFGTEIVSTGRHDGRGLEGKDSVLIEGLNNANMHREFTRDVHALAKDNQLTTMENRFQAAMLAKDSEIRSQRESFEMRMELAATKADLLAGVIADGEKTRDLIRVSVPTP